MAGNVVRATLIADSRQFKSGFKDAEKATKGFDQTIGKTASLAKGLLAGAAAAAVIAFAKDSIRAFSELEQSIGSVESVFGSSADDITTKARTAAGEFGLSMDEFNTSAATLGAQLKNVLGLSAEEAAGQVDDLIGKAADMAATFGGTTADAISAIGSLMRGERDPIEKYGVSMNEASIQAKALELGLLAQGEELDANAKATATLAILNEQTADSAGQFARETDSLAGSQQIANAKMENAKALVGQALSPAMKRATDITGLFAEAISTLAINFLVANEQMSAGEGAVLRWETASGTAITTTEDFAEALSVVGVQLERIAGGKGGFVDAETSAKDFNDEVLNGLKVSGASIELAKVWRSEIGAVADAHNWNKEQTQGAKDALDTYIKQLEMGERPISDNERALYSLTTQTEDTAEATDEATSALQRFEDEVRSQTDPLFNLVEKTNAVAEADQAVIDAEAEFTRNSPQYEQAVLDSALAHEDLYAAQLEVAEQAGMTRSEFETHLRNMGITNQQVIDDILRQFDRVNAFTFSEHTIRVNPMLGGTAAARRALEDQIGNRLPGVAKGGPVEKGRPYIVGEEGQEVFVPDASGTVVPNNQLGRMNGAGVGPSGGAVYNITINAGMGSDPNSISRAVVEALQRYQRNNGSIPIRTRP